MFSLVQYKPFEVAGYEYPQWAIALGWIIAAMSIICIPAAMVHSVLTAPGETLWQVQYSNTDYCRTRYFLEAKNMQK